jgi:hypothetical protein
LSFKYSLLLFLKCLLASLLTLRKIIFIHYTWVLQPLHCFLRSTNFKHSSSIQVLWLWFTKGDSLFGQNSYVLSNSFPCPIDVPIIVLVFQSCKLIFYCNLILLFNFGRRERGILYKKWKDNFWIQPLYSKLQKNWTMNMIKFSHTQA